MAAYIVFLVALLASSSSPAKAGDPSGLQDFCVADKTSKVIVNGFACKDPTLVQAEDFFFSGLDKPTNTANKAGFNVTIVGVTEIPGLNTLGFSLARLDFAPSGLSSPHTHPRATEILTVLEGSLYVGFVVLSSEIKLFHKVLNKGDVFVFPQGQIHFQYNNSTQNAVALAAANSQSPGLVNIATDIFRSKPAISEDILAKAFHVDKKIIDLILAQAGNYDN